MDPSPNHPSQGANQRTLEIYEQNAQRYFDNYSSMLTEEALPDLARLLPSYSPSALDIGAASGRDSAWLADRGYEVVALEPVRGLRERAADKHAGKPILFLDDLLPGLSEIKQRGLRFDVVLLSAVWMHIPPEDRQQAFDTIAPLVRPGGVIFMTYRHGPDRDGRAMFPVSISELRNFAERHLGEVEQVRKNHADIQGRDAVQFESAITRFPKGRFESLAKLREMIVESPKSSTYKLALIRSLCNLCEGSTEIERERGPERVIIPFGAVVLDFYKQYGGLLQLGGLRSALPAPSFPMSSLEFGAEISPLDTRAVRAALSRTSEIVRKYPVERLRIMRPPYSALCEVNGARPLPRPEDGLSLSPATLWSMGRLSLPREIWEACGEHAQLIRAGIAAEWLRFQERRGNKQQR